MRRTLAQALASRIPICLNIAPTDARCVTYINAASERLLNRGHWQNCAARYQISVTKQLLALPPQFATMEQISVCQWPVTVRSLWYEFSPMGNGVVNDPTSANPFTCVGNNARFRGNYPTFQDIVSGNKVRLQCDVLADVGSSVLLLGYDSNGNWVRTNPGGVWQDGESILQAQSPGTTSATTWSKITDIQFPSGRRGQSWLYQWDGTTATLIGQFQYWETNPNYPRYLLPMIPGNATQVDLIGKAAFIPVANPTDYLVIGNLEALRLACLAVKREEENLISEASLFMNGGQTKSGGRIDGAIQLLNDELQHYTGDGMVPTMTVVQAGACEGVESLI